MSGRPLELSKLCSSLFSDDRELQTLVYNSVFFLLESQFIVDPEGGLDTIYQVICGSGMGLSHSGAVAEAALLGGMEEKLLAVQKDHLIDLYVRFKDDILIVFQDKSLLKDFFHIMQKGHPFKIECEEISTQKIQYLDVCIRKGNTQFSISPETKPSKLNTPMLSRHSAHHPNIHTAWPGGHLRQRLSLCSSRELQMEDASEFLRRAEQQNLCAAAIQSLRDLKKQVEYAGAGVSKLLGKPVRQMDQHLGSWLILPFYLVAHSAGLNDRIRNFINSSFARRELHLAFQKPVKIRVGWRNVAPNVVRCMKTCGRGREGNLAKNNM